MEHSTKLLSEELGQSAFIYRTRLSKEEQQRLRPSWGLSSSTTDTLVMLSTLARPLLCIPAAPHRGQRLALGCLGKLVVPRYVGGIQGQVPNTTTNSVRSDPPTKKLQPLT